MRRHQQVEIVHDDLNREVWVFYYLDNAGMVLDRWAREQRETKRHKWKASHFDKTVWTRTVTRDNRIERPEPPQHVIDEALKLYAASLYYGGDK